MRKSPARRETGLACSSCPEPPPRLPRGREIALRILYGVHGYSRGHATRAAAVLSELTRRHEVLIFAGADAYELLKSNFDVQPIDSLRFYYGVEGRISPTITAQRNLPLVADMMLYGRRSRELDARVRAFAPDVAISDAEPWTHRVAYRLDIPRVGFDHFGIMVHCKVPFAPGDRAKSALDRFAYRLLTGQPERVLISSFYDAPALRPGTKVIGPLLREEVHALRTEEPADHLLVYLNNGAFQLTPPLFSALEGLNLPIKLYGCPAREPHGLIEFRPPAGRAFLEDLARARAVISTAGNQLVGEALYYGRPLLVLPEGTVEQRMNAEAVVRLGVGETARFDDLGTERILRFLAAAPGYEANARAQAKDGREDALRLLEGWIEELGRQKAKPRTALQAVRV